MTNEQSLEERFGKLEREKPTDPEKAKKLANLYYSLAVAYNEAGKEEQEIECYEKSLELNPEDRSVLYFLGRAYVRKKEYDKAVELFNKIIKLNPNDYHMYHELSSICTEKGMEEEAKKYQEKYEKIRKKEGEARIKEFKEKIRKEENDK